MCNFKDNFLGNYFVRKGKITVGYPSISWMRETIKLNLAIENSKLVKWIIRSSTEYSREQFATGGFARCPGMHTVSIYCDRRWFCRPPVMRPPWRRYGKKDPALVLCCGILTVVVCFAFCRSSCQEADRRFLRHRIRGFRHRDSGRLPSSCLQLLVVSPKPECINRSRNTSGFNGKRYLR